MLTIGKLMHIDRTDKIAVAREPAFLAVPNPAFGFVLMPTSGTLARCSSFGASEAQNAGLFGFVSEIVDILSIAYHLAWIPKYRRKILTGEVQAETKRLITECCERHGLTLLALETDIDHIHVVVSAPPRFSPAMIANLLKGYSSRYLREKFPRLKKVCGKQHLWTQSYYVGTAGAVSAETIKRYITDCQGK